MSDYTNTYGGAAKDSANATILGADIDTQLDSLETVTATKADKVSGATLDNILTMDANGNLKDGAVTLAALKDLLEPIGTIYHSTVATNPGTSKGFGTWSQIAKGRVLVGEGTGAGLTARTAAATGGQEDAIVVTHQHDAVGDHSHGVPANDGTGASAAFPASGTTVTGSVSSYASGGHQHAAEGEDGTDKNMQPYLVVYIWERTA